MTQRKDGQTAGEVSAWRTRLNLTQAEAARDIGFSTDAVRQWEYGRRQVPPPARLLMRYREAFGPLPKDSKPDLSGK